MNLIPKQQQFLLAQNLGKLISTIKTPFFHKQYFNFSNLVINDPTSIVFTNVTSNCINYDLIIEYLRPIDAFLNQIEDTIENECRYKKLKTHLEINKAVRDNMIKIDIINPLTKIFNLRDANAFDLVNK